MNVQNWKTDEELRAGGASALVEHILDTHHVYTRDSLARLTALAREAAQIEPSLSKLRDLVIAIEADLDPHMMKEERILFPFIDTLGKARAAGKPAPRPMFGTVANPIRMMRHEHDTTKQLLEALVAEMGKHPAMRGKHPLFRGIDEFAADLWQHMHVENDILFPMAESLERR